MFQNNFWRNNQNNGVFLPIYIMAELSKIWRNHGRITSKNYRGLFGIVKDTVHRDLTDLLSKGVILKRGLGKNTYYILSDEKVTIRVTIRVTIN